MSYVLKRIENDDIEKILKDLDCCDLKGRFEYSNRNNFFPKNMAFDEDEGGYFLSIPEVVRPENRESCFALFYKKNFYVVCLESDFGNKVRFRDLIDVDAGFLSRLKAEVINAFSVYGRTGVGPVNRYGISEHKIVANFDKEIF